MSFGKAALRHFWFLEERFNALLFAGMMLVVFAVVAGNVFFSQGRNVIYLVVYVPLILGLLVLGDLLVGWLFMRVWRKSKPGKTD